MKFNKEVIDVVGKLRSTDSIADAKLILEEIRKDRVCKPTASYEEILQMRLHFEELYACDKKYPIFRDDVANLLQGKSHDEQILLLTQMIIIC